MSAVVATESVVAVAAAVVAVVVAECVGNALSVGVVVAPHQKQTLERVEAASRIYHLVSSCYRS